MNFKKITIKVPTDVYAYLEAKSKQHHIGLQRLAGMTLVQGLALIHETTKDKMEEEHVHTEDKSGT
jgi:hypothetical protein